MPTRRRGNPNNRTRTRNRAAQQDAIALRVSKACELRAQRRTFRQIADALGISSRQAFLDVQTGLERARAVEAESVDDMRRLEADLMDRLTRAHFTSATNSDRPDFKSSLILIKAAERRSKILGLENVDYRSKLDMSKLTAPEVETLIALLTKASA